MTGFISNISPKAGDWLSGSGDGRRGEGMGEGEMREGEELGKEGGRRRNHNQMFSLIRLV